MTERAIPQIADLLDKPGHLIRRAHQASVAAFESRSSLHNITAPQHVVMTALFKHRGVDQARLAAMIGLDKATTGNIVLRLEQRGLISRERSATDGRAHSLALTEGGSELLLAMQPLVHDYHDELLRDLSVAERVQLIDLLRRVIGHQPGGRRMRNQAAVDRRARLPETSKNTD